MCQLCLFFLQSEKTEYLRFLTFRLDFNDYHAHQRAQGASVGLTNTPPPHLKFSRLHDNNSTATDGDRMVPTRSDSPTFERNGPEAWTVGEAGKEGKKPKTLGGRSAR